MSQSLAERPLRILIVDDHAIVREGLKRVLEGASRDWTVIEAGSGFQALELVRLHTFDVAVLDVSMPGMSGLELLRRLRGTVPRTRVLMLSMNAEDQYAIRAFKAGASGYLTKGTPPSDLVDAVRKLASGGTYVTGAMAERLVQHMNGARDQPRHSELSDRELDVLRRLVAGQRPAEIAEALHISVKTVSSHKSRMQEKLLLPSTAALIRYGLEHGLAADDMRPE
jgi:DNA-binding NarL/FixJ family response regulator